MLGIDKFDCIAELVEQIVRESFQDVFLTDILEQHISIR